MPFRSSSKSLCPIPRRRRSTDYPADLPLSLHRRFHPLSQLFRQPKPNPLPFPLSSTLPCYSLQPFQRPSLRLRLSIRSFRLRLPNHLPCPRVDCFPYSSRRTPFFHLFVWTEHSRKRKRTSPWIISNTYLGILRRRGRVVRARGRCWKVTFAREACSRGG